MICCFSKITIKYKTHLSKFRVTKNESQQQHIKKDYVIINGKKEIGAEVMEKMVSSNPPSPDKMGVYFGTS